MPIQSIWLCDTGSGKYRQIVNIQLPDVVETINVLCHSPPLMCLHWRGLSQFIQKAGKEYQVLQNIPASGWRRQMSGLMWWNSWSSFHTYLVYGHIRKSSVKAVHIKLLHKMARDEKKLISKTRVDLSRLLRTSLLWSHTSSMWTTGRLRACTRSNRGGWRLTWESGNNCDHVVLS